MNAQNASSPFGVPANQGLRRAAFVAVAFFVVLIATRFGAHAAAFDPQSQPPARPAQAPVTFDGKALFYVQERVFSFSPQDRADAIRTRIERLYRNTLINPASITTADSDNSTDIVVGDLIIMSVTERDAASAGQSRQALAADYAQRIRSTVTEMRRQHGWRAILMASLYTLLATAVLIVVLRLLNHFYPRLYTRCRRWQEARLRSIRIQNFELLPASQIAVVLGSVARLVRATIVIVLVYGYLSLVFSFFPWTRGYAAAVVEYSVAAIRFVTSQVAEYIPNLFFVIVIIVCGVYVSRFFKLIFREIGRETIVLSGFHPEWAEPTYKIIRFLVIALTLVVAFPYLPGSNSPAFRGVSIFLGVLFSLGSSSAVANIVAGVILTYMNAFAIGDRVKIADTVGDIVEKNLLVTRIRTVKNVEITIANSMVLSSHVFNYSKSATEQGLILHTSVTIAYSTPWRQVHQLLVAAAVGCKNILPQPAPFVLQTALNDFYVSYELNAYTDQPAAMAATYSELHQNIQDSFNEAGVEIMSPHYSQLRDGNAVAIPAEYVTDKNPPAAFRVASVPDGVRARTENAGSD